MSIGYNPLDVVSNELRKAAKKGLTLPAAIVDHFNEVDRLASSLAALSATNPMAAAIAEIRKSGKLTDKTAIAVATREGRLDAAKAAKDEAVLEFATILHRSTDELIDSIRDEIYTPAMTALRDAAKRITSDDTVESLMRAGRPEDAQALLDSETHAREVRRAHELVLKFTTTSRTARNLKTYYRTGAEAAAKAIQGASPLTLKNILLALEAGAEPWLPGVAELEAAMAYVSPEEKAEWERSKRQFGIAPNWFPTLG